MAKLKLGPIPDEKPVKLAAELSAAVHRDLLAYAAALNRETGNAVEPAQLVSPMLARFMAGDRGFARLRRVARAHGGRSDHDALLSSDAALLQNSENA